MWVRIKYEDVKFCAFVRQLSPYHDTNMKIMAYRYRYRYGYGYSSVASDAMMRSAMGKGYSAGEQCLTFTSSCICSTRRRRIRTTPGEGSPCGGLYCEDTPHVGVDCYRTALEKQICRGDAVLREILPLKSARMGHHRLLDRMWEILRICTRYIPVYKRETGRALPFCH